MDALNLETVRTRIARSAEIYRRGEAMFLLGSYTLRGEDPGTGAYTYGIDGTYGDYTVTVNLRGDGVKTRCTCPYPHGGCKHIVAACLDIANRQARARPAATDDVPKPAYLTPEEVRELALDGRRERARKERMTLIPGETWKGTHAVRTAEGVEYTVTIYQPPERGHCSCADFSTNHLETCKHLMFALSELAKEDGLLAQAEREQFPFAHVTWSSRMQMPACY